MRSSSSDFIIRGRNFSLPKKMCFARLIGRRRLQRRRGVHSSSPDWNSWKRTQAFPCRHHPGAVFKTSQRSSSKNYYVCICAGEGFSAFNCFTCDASYTCIWPIFKSRAERLPIVKLVFWVRLPKIWPRIIRAKFYRCKSVYNKCQKHGSGPI